MTSPIQKEASPSSNSQTSQPLFSSEGGQKNNSLISILKDAWVSLNLNMYQAIAEIFAERVKDLYPAPIAEKFFKKLTRNFSDTKNMELIDLGCGSGRDAINFAKLGHKVTAIDFSPAMIQIANREKKAAGSHLPVEFSVHDILNLDFKPESFHGVWANTSLLHVPKDNLLSVLKKIYNILKVNGIFFIQVKEGKGEGVEQEDRYDGKRFDKYVAYYQQEDLHLELKNAGFDPIEIDAEDPKDSKHKTPHRFIYAFCQKPKIISHL